MANLGGLDVHTRCETEFTSYNSPLKEGHTSWSDEDRLEPYIELMEQIPVQHVISSDPPLGPGHTGRSGEDSKELLRELKEKCTNLETKVLGLQQLIASHGKEIKKLKLEIKVLQSQRR